MRRELRGVGNRTILDHDQLLSAGHPDHGPESVEKRVAKPACLTIQRALVSSTVPDVTQPDATGASPAATGPPGTLPYAGQVVRRVLLRRNIVIDAETAQLVAAAVHAALQTGTPSR